MDGEKFFSLPQNTRGYSIKLIGRRVKIEKRRHTMRPWTAFLRDVMAIVLDGFKRGVDKFNAERSINGYYNNYAPPAAICFWIPAAGGQWMPFLLVCGLPRSRSNR